jgi:hypothetical protein
MIRSPGGCITTRFSTGILLLALCAFPFSVCTQEPLSAGTVAPDFQLPSVTGGGQVSLYEALGRGTVIVHFWKSK